VPRDGRPTRQRILDAAERLVIDNGYAATSVDQVIAESGTSKGSFFHHFSSKADLAVALVERYAAADIAHLEDAATYAASTSEDPGEQVIAFVRAFEEGADELMSAQSSCLYISVLTERQLAQQGTTEPIVRAIVAWRERLASLLSEAFAGYPEKLNMEALADHVFVTFEGAFLLARSTGDSGHMRAQLTVLRQLIQALLSDRSRDRAPAPG
jgi:TetR/AcrR family transcriptional repressor of nem operon